MAVAIIGITVTRPQTVTMLDIAPIIGSRDPSISGKASIPKTDRINSENLSIVGEKLLPPVSLLFGRISELPMTFRWIVNESNHRRMV